MWNGARPLACETSAGPGGAPLVRSPELAGVRGVLTLASATKQCALWPWTTSVVMDM